ncbi:MAG: hypothetical protein LBO04_01875 [Spirochaetaceae bacterium]|jgi:hypothetical protein|nr:hypothetical protein [Spirochaetaceae bacterium]
MKKQGLILGFAAALLGAAFILSGCESPAGSDGSSGAPGPGILAAATVNAAQLEALFKVNSVVQLIGDGVSTPTLTVDGVVPAGKTLVVAAKDAKVTPGGTLDLEGGGTLEIASGASINASGVSGTAGRITAEAGGWITGQGLAILPFVPQAALDDVQDGLVTYYSPAASVKVTAGSYGDGTSDPVALTATNLATVMANIPEGGSLRVGTGITGLDASGVPAGKTLILAAAGNSISGNFTPAGALVVEGVLATTNGTNSTINVTSPASLKVEAGGTLTLANTGDTLTGSTADSGALTTVTNDGTVSTGTTTPETVETLVTLLPGSGKVILTGAVTLASETATWQLSQNVEIGGSTNTVTAPGHATPFSGGKTITVKNGNTLALGAAPATFTGVSIDNKGTVSTTTTSIAALGKIAALGGKIASSGDVAGSDALTVPEGTDLTHETGTLVGGAGAITINGKAEFTSGTFASQTGAVTVNGEAKFEAATFAALTALTVNGEANFTAATFAALTTVGGSGALFAGPLAAAKAKLLVESGLPAVAVGDVGGDLDAITVTGSGKLRGFAGTVIFGAASAFDGPVGFGGAVTLKAAVTLNGGAEFIEDFYDYENSAFLSFAEGTVLTPDTAGAILTPDNSDKKITLGAQNLTLTGGEIIVAPGAELVLGGKDLTVADEDAALVLVGAASSGGAKLSGAGKVVLGNASISGGASGEWQADGAGTSITFSSSAATEAAIAGSGTTPVLKALTDDSAVITLAKGNTAGDHAALTVRNATIDISGKGAIVFPYVATTGASLKLLAQEGILGALKLGTGDTVNANLNLTQDSHSVTISGTDPVIKGASAADGAEAGIISGGVATPANDATITGKTADDNVTIKAGATLAATSN